VRTIHKIFDEDKADGIVITHGTNTIEETAYFLNLTLKTDKPVVVVGSMRPASAISADGYLNVVNAIKVAADPSSKGRGCLLVMNDTIFNGRDVTKNATYRVEAFQSRDLGPLGYADGDGKIVYYHQPVRKHTTATEFDVRKSGIPAARRYGALLRRRRRRDDRSRRQGRSQRYRQRRHRRRPPNPSRRRRLR
jgi:L-asparaginase